MKYDYDYSRLLGKLRELGLTQLELATRIGLSEAGLSAKLKNKSEFRQSEMLKILDVIGETVAKVEQYFFTHKLVKTQVI